MADTETPAVTRMRQPLGKGITPELQKARQKAAVEKHESVLAAKQAFEDNVIVDAKPYAPEFVGKAKTKAEEKAEAKAEKAEAKANK